jgi:hypothetical protein
MSTTIARGLGKSQQANFPVRVEARRVPTDEWNRASATGCSNHSLLTSAATPSW